MVLRSGIWVAFSACLFIEAGAQSINKAEYFFDTDPGVGNGTALSISPSDPITFTGNISTAGLDPGHHYLFIRTRTSNFKWSLSEPRQFSIAPATEIVEYFIDQDPGRGNGTPFTTTGEDSFTETIPTTDMPVGHHYLFVRSKSFDGKWSLYQPRDFTIASVMQAEYFFDTDPGLGGGLVVPVTPGQTTFTATIPTTTLQDGKHFLFLRTRMGTGRWSLYEPRIFYIRTRIVSAEYFFDTEPGPAYGTRLTVATPSDLITITPTIGVGALPDGDHFLFIRTQDITGRWSLYEARMFTVDSALPIELLSFKATPAAPRRVKLEWSTLSEINNDFFAVQHSTDGMEFSEIGKLKAAGNSVSTQRYETDHMDPVAGRNYYRLKQTDFDGKSTLSKIVSVDLPSTDGPIVYPNPAAGEWFVGFSASGPAHLIELFDLVGRKCLEAETRGESLVKLPRNDLASGTYLVKITSADGSVAIRKIIFR